MSTQLLSVEREVKMKYEYVWVVFNLALFTYILVM